MGSRRRARSRLETRRYSRPCQIHSNITCPSRPWMLTGCSDLCLFVNRHNNRNKLAQQCPRGLQARRIPRRFLQPYHLNQRGRRTSLSRSSRASYPSTTTSQISMPILIATGCWSSTVPSWSAALAAGGLACSCTASALCPQPVAPLPYCQPLLQLPPLRRVHVWGSCLSWV